VAVAESRSGKIATDRLLSCVDMIERICRYIGLFPGFTGLFCGYRGLFCENSVGSDDRLSSCVDMIGSLCAYVERICRYIGLFPGFTGLFCGYRAHFCAVGSGDRLFVCICRARLQIWGGYGQ